MARLIIQRERQLWRLNEQWRAGARGEGTWLLKPRHTRLMQVCAELAAMEREYERHQQVVREMRAQFAAEEVRLAASLSPGWLLLREPAYAHTLPRADSAGRATRSPRRPQQPRVFLAQHRLVAHGLCVLVVPVANRLQLADRVLRLHHTQHCRPIARPCRRCLRRASARRAAAARAAVVRSFATRMGIAPRGAAGSARAAAERAAARARARPVRRARAGCSALRAAGRSAATAAG
jgi:hypothetical protein